MPSLGPLVRFTQPHVVPLRRRCSQRRWVQDAAPAHRVENGGMAAPSQRMASQASPKAAVRDAKEARNARIRRSASFS